MKNNKLLAVLAALLLVTACVQKPAEVAAPDTAADEASLRAQVDSFVAAWNTGDLETYSALIAEDAIEMPQGQAAASGREAIMAVMNSGYDTSMVQQTATLDEAFFMGDYASAYGTWQLNPTEAAGEGAEVTTGKWMALYKRSGDSWVVWRWMWNQTSGPAIPTS